MRIYHNIPALTAYNSLNKTNNAMQKSIEKLSTGLRINSASDDAAGFAISEKMRAQITGMEMAQRNAQDGISMLQTAEGALSETHSILQRMRELSVQAANDTLTQEDRSYIQLEIDELKNQVDNIANTTQFNKKRLLDGSCAGNWSSSDLRVRAYVRGSLREVDQFGQKSAFEGNFKIKIEASATGSGEVQKTSIFKIKHPNVINNVSVNKEAGAEAVRVDNIPAGSYEIKTATAGDATATLTGSYGVKNTIWQTTYTAGDITVSGQTIAGKGVITIKLSEGGSTTVEVATATNGTASATNIKLALKNAKLDGLTVTEDNNGALIFTSTKGEITFDQDSGWGLDTTFKDLTSSSKEKTLDEMLSTAVATSTKNNASILFEVTSKNNNSITLKASSNVLKADGTVETHAMDDIIVDLNSAAKIGALIGEADDAFTFKLDDISSIGAFETGNKFVYNVVGKDDSATVAVKISGTQDMEWPDKWGEKGASVINSHDGDTSDDALTFNLAGDKVANREIHFRNFYLNEDNGKTYEGDIVLTTNDNEIKEGTTLATFDAAYIGKVATGDTKLRDLDKFWNASGVFMLEDPQTITITQGDGKSATVTLYATDTLNDMRNKLNSAIANDLGQGQYVTSDANKFVTFVEGDPDKSGFETVPGTFLIRSLIPGSAGSLTFSGDEDFINAFATNVVSTGSETTFTASLYDAHTGAALATSVKVTGNKLIGVLHENVDIEFDPLADIKATWSDTDKNFILSGNGGYEAVIHLTDSSTIFQTGANEGEDMAIDIGNMSAAALGINGVNVTTRASAMKAVGDLDAAITQVSRQRAKIGAYQNALEWTSENLSTTATNLSAAESRIRDADMAKEMMEFVKLQILNQSGTSMLAQANQLPQSVLSLLQ